MIIKSIDQLLQGRSLVSVTPDATIREACTLLDRHGIGALAVLDGPRLVGILSERDVIRRCIAAGRRTDETRVREIMTPDPQTIRRNASLADAQTVMVEGGFRHLPVIDAIGSIVGMMSIRDVPTEYRLMVERFREAQGAPTAAQ
ncbi:CBS domain-containing protein [Pseudoponticoccus marisrubri]|uniref:Signal transduction protein n=1 Tax=Pseudoponticoccus marisrubri TaxID=1685382 RepID=A0A0W7WGZ7_9RHOB|nr:CBS domain-containing protein [Pseudoponticoccus marisrubri]KUF09807.1 signal transduction protein [Pseudoponticoccus marisrubri]